MNYSFAKSTVILRQQFGIGFTVACTGSWNVLSFGCQILVATISSFSRVTKFFFSSILLSGENWLEMWMEWWCTEHFWFGWSSSQSPSQSGCCLGRPAGGQLIGSKLLWPAYRSHFHFTKPSPTATNRLHLFQVQYDTTKGGREVTKYLIH